MPSAAAAIGSRIYIAASMPLSHPAQLSKSMPNQIIFLDRMSVLLTLFRALPQHCERERHILWLACMIY
jgi:hypothetical protein